VSHLTAELFKQRAGIDMTTVVYKGSAPAWVDVMGGRVAGDVRHGGGRAAACEAGKMRAIAVGGKQRLAALPDVPTLQEAGLPDFEIRSWYGVIAPAKTPPEIVERISREIAEIVKAADVRENFAGQMLEPVGSTPQDFGNFIRAEMRQWEPVAKSANIKE
jgi:tripartite-type tricarboxylate transporter receptor subunit TctC